MAEHRCQQPAIGGCAVVQQPDWTCVACGRGWRHCWAQNGVQWWAEVRGPAVAEHPTPEDRLNTIRTANAYMDDQAGVVEELTTQLRQALRERDEARAELSRTQGQMIDDLHALGEVLGHERTARAMTPQAVLRMWTAEVAELVAEVRRLLFLYDGPFGGVDIERRSAIGIDQCPRIAALLTPAAGPEGTDTTR